MGERVGGHLQSTIMTKDDESQPWLGYNLTREGRETGKQGKGRERKGKKEKKGKKGKKGGEKREKRGQVCFP